MKSIRALVGLVVLLAVVQTFNVLIALSGWWYGEGHAGPGEWGCLVFVWGLAAFNVWTLKEVESL